MRWKTHRHEGSHVRFWQVSAGESGIRGPRVPLSFYVTVWSVYYTSLCAQLYTDQAQQLTHCRHIGVWLKAVLTNALSKGSTNLWDSWQSAASLSVSKNHWHPHLETSLLANKLIVWDKIVWTSSMLKHRAVVDGQLRSRKMLNTLDCYVMYLRIRCTC